MNTTCPLDCTSFHRPPAFAEAPALRKASAGGASRRQAHPAGGGTRSSHTCLPRPRSGPGPAGREWAKSVMFMENWRDPILHKLCPGCRANKKSRLCGEYHFQL